MMPTICLKLITNYGEYLVNAHPTLNQCAAYYVAEFNSGRPVKDIIFKVIPYRAANVNEVLKRN